MTSDPTAVLIGLPHTGKTSFLAILFLAIVEERVCTLRLANFRDDREYVNAIADSMLECRPAKRTESLETGGLSLAVRLPDGADVRLQIPDVSGETWQEALAERSIARPLADAVAEAASICIFIHVDDFTVGPTIADAKAASRALGADLEDLDPVGDVIDVPDSSQVHLVDLLQIVEHLRAPDSSRIALILSAFDTVSDTTPGEWITQNAPLVKQFLTVAQGRFPIDVYGLSAQGGSFENRESADLLSKSDAVDRAYLLTADGDPVDLDTPILRSLGYV